MPSRVTTLWDGGWTASVDGYVHTMAAGREGRNETYMEIKEFDNSWFGKKNKKAKTWELIDDIIKFDGEFCSVMGKAGRTSFHSYLGKSGNRWLEMYGVTSLLNYWGEKERLLQWAVDRAVDYVIAKYEDDEFAVVMQQARSAHKRSLEDAGSHGTDKHGLVEEMINQLMKQEFTVVPEDEQLFAFGQWAVDERVHFLASELPLRSQKLWSAGTTDFICEIGGKRYIGDLKTSNYVSFKNFIQCGAYALMYEEMGKGKIDGIIIAHMPREGGFKVHTEHDVELYKGLFESLVKMVKADKNKSAELYS